MSFSGSSGEWELVPIDLTHISEKEYGLDFGIRPKEPVSSSGESSGWYIDSVELTHLVPPSFELGELQTGNLEDGNDVDYYVIQIPAGGHLTLTLDDLDDLGANEIYIKHGSMRRRGTMTTSSAILVPPTSRSMCRTQRRGIGSSW